MLSLIIDALWPILPAYIANSAVLFAGQTPVDLGKSFVDGKRILGPGKTLKGLIGGTLAGISVKTPCRFVLRIWVIITLVGAAPSLNRSDSSPEKKKIVKERPHIHKVKQGMQTRLDFCSEQRRRRLGAMLREGMLWKSTR
jgi:hypothetical protein